MDVVGKAVRLNHFVDDDDVENVGEGDEVDDDVGGDGDDDADCNVKVDFSVIAGNTDVNKSEMH